MCNLQIKDHFKKKSRDQVDDATNQLQLSKDILSVNFNFILCHEVEKMEALDFLETGQ